MKQKFVMGLLGVLLGAGLAYSAELDGLAMAAAQGDLPETGLFAASNRFSLNSMVSVTNPATGQTAQVVVLKGLGTDRYGILLTLSREAANVLGVYGQEAVYMRTALPADSADLSRYHDGRSFSGDPDYDPKAFVRSNAVPLTGAAGDQALSYGGTATVRPFHTYSPLPADQEQSGGAGTVQPFYTYPSAPANQEPYGSTGTATATVQPFHTYPPLTNSESPAPALPDVLPARPSVVAPPPTPVNSLIILPQPAIQNLPVLPGPERPDNTETASVQPDSAAPPDDAPTEELAQAMELLREQEQPELFGVGGGEPLLDVPAYFVLENEEPVTTEGIILAEGGDRYDGTIFADGGDIIDSVYGSAELPVSEEPGYVNADGGDIIESRVYDNAELPVGGEPEPEYFNADATVPLAEPVFVVDETSLYEPGYAAAENTEDKIEEKIEDKIEEKIDTVQVAESEPVAEERIVVADATDLLGAPVSDGETGLIEPGYTVVGHVAEERIVVADATDFLGEPVFDGETGLVEPGYTVVELEDETDPVDGSEPVPDAEITAADATDFLGEPVPDDETGLVEPGFAIVEREDEPVQVDGHFGVGGGEEVSASLLLNEPAYTTVSYAAEATTLLGAPASAEGNVLNEPHYLLSIETFIYEPVADAATEEEDAVPTPTASPPAPPADPPVEERALSDVIPEIKSESQTVPVTAVETTGGLQAGMYYVQIGGYNNMARIEALMNELGGSYPLVLMGGRYILIGPLNEGESNAVELQFRAKGFANAFVVIGKAAR
jgi:hypothetical protein